MVYKEQKAQLASSIRASECCFIYGSASVGKSFMFTRDDFAEIIDCTEMISCISQLEDVDMALDYL